MIIDKITKSYVEIDGRPNENWTGDTDKYFVVDSNSELAQKIRDNCLKFEYVLDEEGNLIDVEPTLPGIEEVLPVKIEELSNACTSIIYRGLDITLSDGSVQHFTLDEQDQLNLSGIALKLLTGTTTTIAWHEDDQTKSCQFYSAEDAWNIIGTLTVYKEYHITYFRDLRIYINTLTSSEEIQNIVYGFNIPEEYKSDVLKAYEVQMGLRPASEEDATVVTDNTETE